MSKVGSAVSGAFGVLWAGVFAAFWGGVAGLVVGLVLDVFAAVHLAGSSSLTLMIAAAIVAGLGGIVFMTSVLASDAKKTRDMATAQVDASRNEERDRLAATARENRDACFDAVAAFQELPNDLRRTREWIADARGHFEQHAYSPFWQSIEHAYDCLGHYNGRIRRIGDLHRRHALLLAEYSRLGGKETVLPFPVQIDAATAANAASSMVRTLDAAVYKAQRDPVFAQIWEQRRTTAAVIQGFANLDVAVRSMSATLTASVAALAVEVRGVGTSIGDASRRAGTDASAQLHAQQDLNAKVDQAVYYLREEDKRALRRV